MSYFKIVTTREKRGIYFSVVPSQWEQNNILFWPNLSHREREILRADAESVPNFETWEQLPCVVKLSNIPNFQTGLMLEKKLSACIDSDAEETLFDSMKKDTKKLKQKCITLDRNYMFEDNNIQILTNFKLPNTTEELRQPSMVQLNTIKDYVPNIENNGFLTGGVQSSNNSPELLSDVAILDCPVDIQAENNIELKEIIKDIAEIKEEFLNFKQEIKVQYAKINVTLDKLHDLIANNKHAKETIQDITPKENFLEKYDFPLTSCEEMSALEADIRQNKELKSQLILTLSNIGGTSGNEDGSKVAYKIIDFLFSPDLLTKYSWTGIVRSNKSVVKTSFQLLEGILSVLFEVILKADNRHTQQRNANIFKEGVLKHAKKRSQRKRVKFIAQTNAVSDENTICDDELPDNEVDPVSSCHVAKGSVNESNN